MNSTSKPINILFLCTGNSCRSQMAEGLGNMIFDEHVKSFSAGIESHGINPYATEVMKELGYDLTTHESNTTDKLEGTHFDYVVTVCGHANEVCPIFEGGKLIHYGFDDPPKLSKNLEGEERLAVYRRIRDEIHEYLKNLQKEHDF